ncbi:retrovirus-related Pol polyprotein from type-1 retrotransposable element R2 [Clonorchis sinensis]|uniref:Retrovirus-related Pol polyprotein from type-1 retrotransposable element R2 n=1 Tax=Clonorchis sinensis TaxID=79923 RepID=G7YPJ1_CLOSI|nr:retrovirus-related Pol polyprotein from type-1 retrotransposable element R2 [Clonorchis sinensis]
MKEADQSERMDRAVEFEASNEPTGPGLSASSKASMLFSETLVTMVVMAGCFYTEGSWWLLDSLSLMMRFSIEYLQQMEEISSELPRSPHTTERFEISHADKTSYVVIKEKCRLGSLDVGLGELRVQQLQTELTTLFDSVHYESSGASAPVPTSTQESFMGLTCEECGKCCKSKAGLVAHHRVHGNDSVGHFHTPGKLYPDAIVSYPIGCRSTESKSAEPTKLPSRPYTTKDGKVQRLLWSMGHGRIYTKGKRDCNDRQHLLKLLDKVTRAPLKGHRKTELTRYYLIPRLKYSLMLGNVHRNTFKRLDNCIRQSIRGWLRLPKDTPISYLHAGKQHGGLGIPSLSATIPMQRRVRMEKLLSTQCRVLRNVVNDSAFGKIVWDLSLPIRVHGSRVNTTEELVAACTIALTVAVYESWSLRLFLIDGLYFQNECFLGIQLRCNLLRTKVRSARHGHCGQTILCRRN